MIFHFFIFFFFFEIKLEIEKPKRKNDQEADTIQDRKSVLTAEAAFNVFKRISDEDAKILGKIARQYFFLQILPKMAKKKTRFFFFSKTFFFSNRS